MNKVVAKFWWECEHKNARHHDVGFSSWLSMSSFAVSRSTGLVCAGTPSSLVSLAAEGGNMSFEGGLLARSATPGLFGPVTSETATATGEAFGLDERV